MAQPKKTKDAYYFPFGAKDWRSSESVRLMSPAERGCFVDLLCIAWLSSDEPCSIPSGDVEIAALLGIQVSEWTQYAPRVLAEFDETTKSGRLRNEKLWDEYQRMRSEHKRKVQGGRTSALRRRDTHGRLLPASPQESTSIAGNIASASQSHSQSHSQVVTTPAKTTRDNWLLPASLVWESRFGAGSFPWGEFGKQCKSLKGHHPPDVIAAHLGRYLSSTDPQYVSSARFAKLFATFAPVPASELVDEFGCLTPLGDRETRPAPRIAS